jgi:cytoskeleton protein RodZ
MLADSKKDASSADDAARSRTESEHSLRVAREQQQLTVDDVATVLHLSREHIVALEAGDFTRLGPQVFVRGYLRSYAKLLGLPEQSVLTAFPLADMERVEFQTMSVPADLRPGFYPRAWMMWAALGLVLLIAALMFLASTLDTDNDRTVGENAGGKDEAVATVAASSTAGKVTDSRADKPRFTVIEPGPESANSSLPRFPVATGISVPEAEPAIAAEVATEAVTEAATEAERAQDSLIVDSPAESTLALAPVAARTSPDVAPAAGKVRLTLAFSDECWVEIADSQRSLLYGLEKPGSVVNLDGVPPFKLFFGNRQAVEISLSGKPFVIPASAADSGNTARFTIKAEQS